MLIIIEELEPYLEEQIRLLGLKSEITGKEFFPVYGELNLEILEKVHDRLFGTSFFSDKGQGVIESKDKENKLPARPPVLCTGCSSSPGIPHT